MRWILGLLLLAVVTGGWVYLSRDPSGASVRLATVERSVLVSSLTTNGKVEPLDARELRALSPGMIGRIAVREGDRVRAGERLMELDRTEGAAEQARAEAELHTAEAELQNVQRGGNVAEKAELENLLQKARLEQEEAARELGKSERLFAKSAAPKSEVDAGRDRLRKADQDIAYLERRKTERFSAKETDRAQARVTEAQAALRLAKQRLESTLVNSPVGGVVYTLPVQRGNFVNRGDLLAKVADLAKLRLKVYVDEPELGRLASGQDVIVTWDAYPGTTWKGIVDRLPAEVTLLGTRSVGQVECVIENKDGKLLPNVSVNVEVVGKRSEQALTLPKDAVVAEGGSRGPAQHFVFLYQDGKVARRPVSVGITTATRVEILNGVSDGQTVAIAMDRKLADGMKVKSDGAGATP